MSNTETDSGAWHLDRRVPIALIITIVLQATAIVWWGAKLSARVEMLEHTIAQQNDDHERLVRVETTVQSIDRRLARMEDRR